MNKHTPKKPFAKPLLNVLGRFHLTLFFVLVVAGLVGAVMVINDTLNKTAASKDYTSPINAGSIDQVTLDRVKSLHTSTETVPETPIPTGRINPFGE